MRPSTAHFLLVDSNDRAGQGTDGVRSKDLPVLVYGEDMQARTSPKATGDLWLLWLLALASITAPVIVLLVVYSIPKGNLSWSGVYVSVKRGDFLIPVMLLCVETVRCWWREAKRGSRFRHFVRILATTACAAASLVCVCATTIATHVKVTSETGHSIATITVGCLSVALVFGTAAVWVSTWRGEDDGQR